MVPIHIFEQLRPLLFATAYKMTRSITDAEDILQEVWIGFSEKNIAGIESPRAYLVRSVMNRSLNLLEKKKHIIYPGIDLPEPVSISRREYPAGEDISFALLMLLQKLTPVERAVFILKESFDYKNPEIAGMLGIKEDHCRQLLHRAKEKIGEKKTRFISSPNESKAFADAFMKATSTGDLEKFILYLKEDMVIYSDGGGKVSAAVKPVSGREACLKMLAGIYSKRGEELSFYTDVINGEPAVIFCKKGSGEVDTVVVMEVEGGQVGNIYMVRNPDKLRLQ